MYSNTDKGPGNRPSDLALRRRILSVPSLIAMLLAVALLSVAAAQVFDIDWSEMWRRIRATDPWMYALALVAYYASFWFRGLRWRLIARTAGLDRDPRVRIPGTLVASGIILMGWFANSIAPFRLGDAYRGWAFARESRAPWSASLGTVFAERVQDMGAVLILVLMAALWVAKRGEAVIPSGVIVAAVVMVLLLILLLLAMRAFGMRLAARLPGKIRVAYGRFQIGTLSSFRPRDLPLQLVLGVIGWLLEISRFYFVAEGLGFDISFPVVMFAALANAMLTTIPTPGGFGFVEAGLTGVLALLGLDDTAAAALTVVDRSISWLSVIVFGGALFVIWQWVGGRSLVRSTPPAAGPTEDPST